MVKKSMAQIALVVSAEDNTVSDYNRKHGNIPQEYFGWAQALTEEHILFDVIRTSDIKELGRHYKLLIMPNTMSWSDSEIADVQKYLNNGGKVVATGKSFSLTTGGDVRQEVKFKGNIWRSKEFFGEKYHVPKIGAGWYGNGATYFDDRDVNAKKAMLKTADYSKYKPVVTNLPSEVIINAYVQKYDKFSGVVIKMLNLTGTASANKGFAVPGKKEYEFINYPTIEKDCSITIQSAEKITGVYMISPDFNEIVNCQFTNSGKNNYTIKFPLLARYGIIYCATQNDLVKALAPQADFINGKPEILPFDYRYVSIR